MQGSFARSSFSKAWVQVERTWSSRSCEVGTLEAHHAHRETTLVLFAPSAGVEERVARPVQYENAAGATGDFFYPNARHRGRPIIALICFDHKVLFVVEGVGFPNGMIREKVSLCAIFTVPRVIGSLRILRDGGSWTFFTAIA